MIALIANWKRILYGTALALLGTLLLVQTARIEGALFWKGLKAENTELRETVAKVEQAQKLATKLAIEEKARIEAENKRKAENAKIDYEKRLATNDAALRKWLRSQAGRSTGNTDLSGSGEATSGTIEAGAAPDIPATYAIVPIADLELSAQAFAKLEALQAFWLSVAHQSNQPSP